MDMNAAERDPNPVATARRLEAVAFDPAQVDAIVAAADRCKGPNADTLAAVRGLEAAGFESAQADAMVATAKQGRNLNMDVLKTARSLEAAGFESPQADALIEVFGAPRAAQGAGGFANDDAQMGGLTMSQKSRLVTFLLAFFFGLLGIHRFYVGKMGTGVAMLLTAGGLGIWVIIDIIIILVGAFTDKEGRKVTEWT